MPVFSGCTSACVSAFARQMSTIATLVAGGGGGGGDEERRMFVAQWFAMWPVSPHEKQVSLLCMWRWRHADGM